MVLIGSGVNRPTPERVTAIADVPTSILADVTESTRTVMDHEIKPVGPTSMAGTALTVRAPPGDNLTVHKAVTLAQPGDVLIVDAGGDYETAIWGELLSTSAAAHELAGTVVDGAVRDVAEIDELGYPVYARAVCPKPPEKANADAINVPVTCGGLDVSPGDVVVGDAEGVAVVAPEDVPRVREEAVAKLKREDELKSSIADGAYLYDLLGLEERVDGIERRSLGTGGSDPGE